MKEMTPLRFLLGNNTLSLLAGSETWTYTLAVQLKKMGHEVHCFSPELGEVSRRMEDAGIRCFTDLSSSGVKPFSIVLEEKVDHKYDVIIANHNNIVKYLRSQYPRTPIISTIHGIIHDDGQGNIAPEHPALDAGVQQFVSVSEEVQSLLREQYHIDSVIVRNFLDTEHFKAKRKISKKPKQILFNSNYHDAQSPEVAVLREVAKHYDAKLAAIGQNFVPTADPMKQIELSDIVVGMGRSVLEGLSAEKISIVFGRWGYGGIINQQSFESLRATNFSGREVEKEYQGKNIAQVIIHQIDGFYLPDIARWGRNYVLREHNVTHAADFFVQLSREFLGQPTKQIDDRRPYRRARDVQ